MYPAFVFYGSDGCIAHLYIRNIVELLSNCRSKVILKVQSLSSCSSVRRKDVSLKYFSWVPKKLCFKKLLVTTL